MWWAVALTIIWTAGIVAMLAYSCNRLDDIARQLESMHNKREGR